MVLDYLVGNGKYDIKNFDIGTVGHKTALCWFIHPETKEEFAVTSWKEFLGGVAGKNAIVFLNEPVNPDLLPEICNLRDNGQVYLGGWAGLGMPIGLGERIPNQPNLVLGYRLGYCVKKHVEYLGELGVDSKHLAVLQKYSFCCEDLSHITEAVKTYRAKGVNVRNDDIETLLGEIRINGTLLKDELAPVSIKQ
jgi:hypothetical protein